MHCSRSRQQMRWRLQRKCSPCGRLEGRLYVPAADDLVHPPRCAGSEVTAMTKWQFPNEVAIQVLRDVEVGVSTAFPRPQDVADEAITAKSSGVGNERFVIDRVRPCVVEVELDAVTWILVNRDQQPVVIRVCPCWCSTYPRQTATPCPHWTETARRNTGRRVC